MGTIQSVKGLNKTRIEGREICSLLACLVGLGQVSPTVVRLELTPLAPLVLGPSDLDWNYIPLLLGLWLADGIS